MMPFPGKQALDIVDSVLELPAEERASYLDQIGCDSSLRQYVEGLVLSYERSGGNLDEPAVIAHAHLLDPTGIEPWLGRHIGSYQLLEELGEGGMGTVYRAARADDQYRKQVALKILKSAFGGSSASARFKTERQILANLEHPNVARLLDGGNTAEGLPFFVMELVDGQPIDDYCDSNRLPVRDRLELFRTVCAAVQYAHKNHVIHRDLKPGNVFVTRDGTPKLLDFGIAKILENVACPAPVGRVFQTMRMLTPEYASPEQVRGEPIAAATDVYSLGVMLYWLLTGHRPYPFHGQSPQEIAQVICDTQPQAPSTVVRGVHTVSCPDGSSTREENVGNLSRALAGDLDTIVLKALNKEPQRRYDSVEAFSEDIRRHLVGLPVLARRNTVAYRSIKFVRRNRSVVAAAAMLLLTASLAVGLIAVRHSGVNRLEAAAGIPFHARPSVAVLGFTNLSSRPQTAWLSTALSEMLNTELAAGEKLRAIPGANIAQMKVDLALEDSANYGRETFERIQQNLGADMLILGSYFDLGEESGGQVRLDVNLQNAITGETLSSMSVTGIESHLPDMIARVGAGLRSKLGVPDVTTAEATAAHAAIPANPAAERFFAEGLQSMRRFDAVAAGASLQKAIAAEPDNGPAHAALAGAWLALGYDSKAADAAKQAFDLSRGLSREQQLNIEALYRQTTRDWAKAADIYKALCNFFPDNLDYGLRLAEAQISAGSANDALLGIEALRRLPPPAGNDPRIDLAESLAARSLGDYRRVETVAADAIRKGNAAGMQSVVARASIAQGVAFSNSGEFKNAVASAQVAKQIYESTGERGGVAAALNTLANSYYESGDLNEAKKAFRQALQIYREIGNKRGAAGALDNLANVIGDEGKLEEAKRLSYEALAVFREIGDERGIGSTLNNIATDLILQGDLGGAVSTLRSALGIRRKLGDLEGIAVSLDNMGAALLNQAELAESRSSLEEALNIRRASGRSKTIGSPLEGLGEVMAASGDLAAAKRDLDEALKLAQETGEKHLAGVVLTALAQLLLQQDQLQEARKAGENALEIRNTLGEKGNAQESAVGLGEIALEEGRFTDAEHIANDALKEFQAENLADDEMIAHTLLASALLGEGKPGEAHAHIARARQIGSRSQNRLALLELTISEARVTSALGKPDESRKLLSAALAQTKKFGLVGLEFEARLSLADVDWKWARPASPRPRLDGLSKEAAAKNFTLIAKKATLARNR